MPKVYNKHHKDAPPDAIYVGRPTKWGNPHPVGDCKRCSIKHERGEAVVAFRKDVEQMPEFIAKARTYLKGKDLVCWCAPKACHADVLLEIANG